MKWYQFILSILPLISDGVSQAQAIHGDSNPEAKKAHVLKVVQDGVIAANFSGKVSIDPALAAQATEGIFREVDTVHAIVKANQPAAAPGSIQ